MRNRKVIERVYDTRNLSGSEWERLGGAVSIFHGTLAGYHVTDDPESVLRSIAKGRITDPVQAHRELGPGLYISDVPQYWSARSSDKYGFLRTMPADDRAKLANAAYAETSRLESKGYITHSEATRAKSYLHDFENGNVEAIIIAGGQPYNLPISDAKWLRSIGLGQYGSKARMIEIRVQGKFVEVKRSLVGNEWRTLSRRFDGAIKRGGFGTNPEAVIWNPDAIVHVGDPESVE